ncbi:hypothetical protein [Streptomyces tendae]
MSEFADASLGRLQDSTESISGATRMKNRRKIQSARKNLTEIQSAIDQIANLDLNVWVNARQHQSRAIRARNAASHISARYIALRQTIAPPDRVTINMEMHLLMSRLEEILKFVAYSCEGCATSLAGARFLASTPRFERVRFTIARMAALAEDAGTILDTVCDDYAGADLREVDISTVDLSWLRWNEETKWPLTWERQIRRMSIEVSPGHWVIQPVDTNSDLHLLI